MFFSHLQASQNPLDSSSHKHAVPQHLTRRTADVTQASCPSQEHERCTQHANLGRCWRRSCSSAKKNSEGTIGPTTRTQSMLRCNGEEHYPSVRAHCSLHGGTSAACEPSNLDFRSGEHAPQQSHWNHQPLPTTRSCTGSLARPGEATRMRTSTVRNPLAQRSSSPRPSSLQTDMGPCNAHPSPTCSSSSAHADT